MPRQTGVILALKDWGLTVHEVPGWMTRGSADFDPRGHVAHHDVIGPHTTVPRLIIDGRSDLPGPLANFWLERDGDVWLVAAGRANHAGEGGWNGLSGNSSVYGTEANNLGVPSDPWPEVQLEAWYRLCAATAEFSGFPVANVCGHKEWTTRKIDPHSLDMGEFRRKVAAAEKGLTVAEAQEIKAVVVKQGQKTRELIRKLYKAESKQNRRLSDKEVDAILDALEADGG